MGAEALAVASIISAVAGMAGTAASIHQNRQQQKAMEKAAKNQRVAVPDKQAAVAKAETPDEAANAHRKRLQAAAAQGRAGTMTTGGGGMSL